MMRLLHDLVTAQARQRPESVALVMASESMTYGQLERDSSRLAHLLQAMGTQAGDRICLFLPKSPLAIVGMLATLKVGAIYVPIDLTSPPSRVAKVLRACAPRCILLATAGAMLLDQAFAALQQESPPRVIALEPSEITAPRFCSRADLRDLEASPAQYLGWRGSADMPAHILFTSGSTGAPKGVVITHGNVLCFIDWAMRFFGIQEGERISGHPPLHFDLSTFDIYGTFAAGAELHLVSPELSLLPHKLATFMRSTRLHQWFSVPSILAYMAKFDVVQNGDFPEMKRLLWCGEVLPTPTLIYWMQRLPHVRFTNLYGPTETTIASSYYTIPRCPRDGLDAIPIGQACAGERLLILDDKLQPTPQGEVGELYIQGVGLSPGYWEEPQRTAAAFLTLPGGGSGERVYRTGDLARLGPDGLIYFLGRVDTQIKSRGYRIELGEIETALNAMECLRECAVVAVPTDGFEGMAICCAYVPVHMATTTPAQLRQDLAKHVPSYMLPSRWKVLAQMPKNANGKIDRRLLMEGFATNAVQHPGK